jgi:hypothetical protein
MIMHSEKRLTNSQSIKNHQIFGFKLLIQTPFHIKQGYEFRHQCPFHICMSQALSSLHTPPHPQSSKRSLYPAPFPNPLARTLIQSLTGCTTLTRLVISLYAHHSLDKATSLFRHRYCWFWQIVLRVQLHACFLSMSFVLDGDVRGLVHVVGHRLVRAKCRAFEMG